MRGQSWATTSTDFTHINQDQFFCFGERELQKERIGFILPETFEFLVVIDRHFLKVPTYSPAV